MDRITSKIESILFVAGEPVLLSELCRDYLLIGSLLLLGSIFAGKATDKLGAPLLLLFLGIGLLCGERISFTDSSALSLLGELALVFILFSGGLDTKYADIRPIAVRGGILATSLPQTRRGLTLLSQLCRDPAVRVRNAEEA